MIKVKDHPDHPPVKEGDHVIITDYSNFPSNDAVKYSKLPFSIVEGVDKHLIGENGDYHWEYGIYVGGWLITSDQYKLFK